MSDPNPPASRRPTTRADVPSENVDAYARIYQLERWLREMVYLELKAQYGSTWESEYEKRVGTKARRAEGAKERDKPLTHMRTKEQRILEYADLGDLFAVIYDDTARQVDPLFAPFLPPGDVLGGKLREVLFIRLRTMHCRSLHQDDIRRLEQFLRDVDQGFWHWCTSYNDPRIPNLHDVEDVIGKRFYDLDPRPYVRTGPGSALPTSMRVHEDPVGLQIEYSVRPQAMRGDWRRQPLGSAGWLYHVSFFGNPPADRQLDCQALLKATQPLHERCIYIQVRRDDSIELSLPKVDDPAALIELIDAFYQVSRTVAFRRRHEALPDNSFYADITKPFGETVLGPDHPLGLLTTEMPCSWFGLDIELPRPNPRAMLAF